MVPIHDTDVAEERWKRSAWNRVEFWEDIESRFRRQRKLWIAFAICLFLALSSVPVVLQDSPKWRALSASRALALEINRLKKEAALAHTPLQIRFVDPSRLAFQVEKSGGEVVRKGELLSGGGRSGLVLLTASQGEELGIPGLIDHFSFDPVQGALALSEGAMVKGFGILSVKDLAEKRLDRLSLLILQGQSAEISFE